MEPEEDKKKRKVQSEIGSGLHTFVLYLGPHIAFFTTKAMQCGRVDIKSAPYDTISLNRTPSWLKKDSSISSGKSDELEEFNNSTGDHNGSSSNIDNIKRWLLSHSQYLNFFTILLLASMWEMGRVNRVAKLANIDNFLVKVDIDWLGFHQEHFYRKIPNPLFDLAGIMCGQFGIPFWVFFLATVLGKAIFKAHIQASQGETWDLSFATIWNSIIWLMLLNFFSTIITSTAQGYLKKEQEKEMELMKKK
ncbi:hypothetical protein Tco_0558207 [Tanacetum coccineum]